MRQWIHPKAQSSLIRSLGVVLVILAVLSSTIPSCSGSQSAQPPAQPQAQQQAQQPAQAKTVKVGVLLSLTGNMGGTGKAINDGIQFVVDELINKAGGIKSLGGATIQIVRADTASEAKVALSEMEKLLSVEKPSLVLGPYASGEVVSAAPLLEKYKTPGLSIRTTGDPIFPMNLQYWRTIAVPSTSYGASMAKQVIEMKKEYGIKADRIAIIAGDASWWSDYARKGAQDAFAKAGMSGNIVDDIMYDPKTKDYGPLVTRLKGDNADVLVHGAYFEEAVLLHKARQALDYFPPVVVGTDTGYSTPKIIDAIGADMTKATVMGNGVFAVGYWSSAVPLKASQDIVAKSKDWTTANKVSVDVDFMMGVQAGLLMRRALETAASTDPQKINEAFHNMEVKMGDPDFIIPAFAPAIAWEPNGKPKNADWVLIQWMDKDKWNVIYPKELRTAEPVFKK